MAQRLVDYVRGLGHRLHAFCLGTTVALLAAGLKQAGQTCAISGQCATCGACVPTVLPIVALPLLVDGALTIATRILGKREAKG